MPVIPAGNAEIGNLKGLHLWHGGLSNCSQRCRIVLSKLGLSYESNLVNLQAAEHATRAFHELNPSGVVPVLVHDGQVVVNSVDIIAHLETHFGDGSLLPVHLKDEIAALLERCDKAQLALKYCTFEFLFQHGPRPSEETFAKLMAGLDSEWLRNFHIEYRAGFDRNLIHTMVTRAHEDFQYIESTLADGRVYLTGDEFTLADIAWMPNFHRFDLLRWPLERYDHGAAWFERVSQLDCYIEALKDWEPQALFDKAFPVLDQRRANNDGIDSYGPFAS